MPQTISAVGSRLVSWRTTLTGITGFLAVVALQLKYTFDSDPATVTDWNVIVLALTTLITGLTARDNAVSSEQAGAGVIPPK